MKNKRVFATERTEENVTMKRFFCYVFSMMLIGCASTQPVPWVSTPEYEVEYDLAWDLTVGLLNEHFDIEVAEKESGYLRTEWKPIVPSSDVEDQFNQADKVGVRVTCRVEGRFPFQLKMKVERGLLRDGVWAPIWVDYSREAICQRCSGAEEWLDEQLGREILRELGMRLSNSY